MNVDRSKAREDRLRQKFGAEYIPNLTKREKAQHNGVDTRYWGNNAPFIVSPPGWEDHQHTQQLIRKYLKNNDVVYSIEEGLLTIFITSDEWKILSPDNKRAEFCGVYLSVTFMGCCLVKYNSRSPRSGDIKCFSYAQFAEYSGDNAIVRKAVLEIRDFL